MPDTTTLTRGSSATGTPADPAPPQKKKRGRRLVLVVLVVVLAAGATVYLRGRSSGAAHVAPAPGAVLKLDALYVNLSGGHYLKLGIALQASATAPKDLDGSRALDTAIDVFSDQDMAALSDAATRTRLKAALVSQVRTAYGDEVLDLYFTEFVMQ